MSKPRSPVRRTGLALAGAVAAHLLVAAAIWLWPDRPARPAAETEPAAAAVPPGIPADDSISLAAVALIGAPSAPVAPIEGAADRAPDGHGHPLPAADVDSPGERAAARAGGGSGGAESVSEQHYRRDAHEQPWSHPDTTRQARHRNGARAGSREAILRDPDRGLDDRTSAARARARAGQEQGRPGGERGNVGPADGTPIIDWDRMDPRYHGGAGARVAQRSPGAVDPRPARAYAERGAPSADALRDGVPADRRDVAGASAETDPLPIDLVSPRSGGGNGDGIRGRERIGHSARGHGAGTAASTAEIDTGAGTGVIARRDDPYFRRLHDRLEREVRFPRELALRLEQGDLVARFVLRADGAIDQIEVSKPSGFAQFDRELVRALRAVSPLGPVPRGLLGRADRLAVVLDYAFRNPVIR